jgi:hypothetical protein
MLDKFGMCTSFLNMEPQGIRPYPPSRATNVYVSGKNNKILPISEAMQGISISAESKEERSKNNILHNILKGYLQELTAKDGCL